MRHRPTCTLPTHSITASHAYPHSMLIKSSRKAEVWEGSATAEPVAKQELVNRPQGRWVGCKSWLLRRITDEPDHVSGWATKFKIQKRERLLPRQAWMLWANQFNNRNVLSRFLRVQLYKDTLTVKTITIASSLNTLKDTKLCNSQLLSETTNISDPSPSPNGTECPCTSTSINQVEKTCTYSLWVETFTEKSLPFNRCEARYCLQNWASVHDLLSITVIYRYVAVTVRVSWFKGPTSPHRGF